MLRASPKSIFSSLSGICSLLQQRVNRPIRTQVCNHADSRQVQHNESGHDSEHTVTKCCSGEMTETVRRLSTISPSVRLLLATCLNIIEGNLSMDFLEATHNTHDEGCCTTYSAEPSGNKTLRIYIRSQRGHDYNGFSHKK